MKTTKYMILLGILGLSSYTYACRSVIVDTPNGSMVCFICNDGKYINCDKL